MAVVFLMFTDLIYNEYAIYQRVFGGRVAAVIKILNELITKAFGKFCNLYEAQITNTDLENASNFIFFDLDAVVASMGFMTLSGMVTSSLIVFKHIQQEDINDNSFPIPFHAIESNIASVWEQFLGVVIKAIKKYIEALEAYPDLAKEAGVTNMEELKRFVKEVGPQ